MGIEDKLNQVKGALKEGVGKLSGDKKTELEGAVEKAVALYYNTCQKKSIKF